MDTDRLTELIIGCAYSVANTLGRGFLEKVYENALINELRKREVKAEQQVPVSVRYDNVVVGDYVADILVEQVILIEVKAVKALENIHRAQCVNYLNATGLRLCLLINFGSERVQVRRIETRPQERSSPAPQVREM